MNFDELITQLNRYKELYDMGILDEKEFEEQKAEVMKQLHNNIVNEQHSDYDFVQEQQQEQYNQYRAQNAAPNVNAKKASISDKATRILSYLGWLWLVAYFAGNKEDEKFHINQGLVLMLFETGYSFIGGIIQGTVSMFSPLFVPINLLIVAVGIFLLVLQIMGIVNACHDEEKELPIIGTIRIMK